MHRCLGMKGAGESKMNEETEKITIRLPKRYVRALDFLVELDDFSSRSEAIRSALRDMVYQRTELVMDKVEKIKKAEEALASMENYQKQYMKQ
jgi:Arc/MetJ-type ribon-helix-helix transcriptional regulator